MFDPLIGATKVAFCAKAREAPHVEFADHQPSSPSTQPPHAAKQASAARDPSAPTTAQRASGRLATQAQSLAGAPFFAQAASSAHAAAGSSIANAPPPRASRTKAPPAPDRAAASVSPGA